MKEKANHRLRTTNHRPKFSAVCRLPYVVTIILLTTLNTHSQTATGDVALMDYEHAYYSQVFGYKIPDVFNYRLYDEVSCWLGTPYRYAGKNEKGIDCSGFVNRVYSNVFGIPLTGNSVELYQASKHLKKNKLKEGDLVFFKIHRKRISHVGLYLGDNKFAHSSLTNGVIISDLDEPYYRKRFICGGKISHDRLLTTNNE